MKTSKLLIFTFAISLFLSSCRINEEVQPLIYAEDVMDIDGNVYKSVKIGDQVWMAENFKVTHYPDGREIPLVTDTAAWAKLENNDDAYSFYDNSTSSNYGAFYTWAAAINKTYSSSAVSSGVQGVCPNGWHIPSSAEWIEMRTFLANDGNLETMSSALKSYDWNGTDIYGFSALPGGYRSGNDGKFGSFGDYAYWWTSTEQFWESAEVASIEYYDPILRIGNVTASKSDGVSIRCVKD